jgi:hypothetical protein
VHHTSAAMASSGPNGIFAFSVEGRRTMLLLREGWSFEATCRCCETFKW